MLYRNLNNIITLIYNMITNNKLSLVKLAKEYTDISDTNLLKADNI
jgi:hypothetical protein